MNITITLLSFVACTALVAFTAWLWTRSSEHGSNKGFFLAGRSLTFPVIAGSLLLTNLSTEQLVGLNGDAFSAGLSVMAWEVVAVAALTAMAWFFLPRYLKSGITTLPELLEIRFDRTTRTICDVIFLAAYTTILLPIILYTGASGLNGILDMKELTGIQSDSALLWLMVWIIGIIGCLYAFTGGLKIIAVSDTLNGILLLSGGLMITLFALDRIGEGSILQGITTLKTEIPERFNSIGGANDPVPFGELFTGVLIINFFYWCTNQQIIQRTLAARNLAEGQKGVLLCALLKLLGPVYLVLPGILAYYIFIIKGAQPDLRSVDAYGTLVRNILPHWLSGFFMAAMTGAILSSFNSALNSTCTIFSLGLYKKYWKKDAGDAQVIRAGNIFGGFAAVFAMCMAPLLMGQTSIFGYLQVMNGIYFIPIFAVVLLGLLNHFVPPRAAQAALMGGVIFITLAYFVIPLTGWDMVKAWGGNYHFLGIVFLILVVCLYLSSLIAPIKSAWVQHDTGEVDLTPWKGAIPAGILLFAAVILIYILFADFSVLSH